MTILSACIVAMSVTAGVPGKALATEDDTTKIKIGKVKIWIIGDKDMVTINNGDTVVEVQNDTAASVDKKKPKRNKHWAGLEIGVNGYVTPTYTLSPPAEYDFLELNYAKSVNFNFNFLEKDIRIVKEYVKLITGLGLTFNSYSFKQNMTLIPGGDTIRAIQDTLINFQKNKLKTTFITLPVMLAFNTSADPEKALHIAVGIVFGYKLGSKTKQKYETGDEKYKPKVKSDFNLLPFRYSARVGVGYGNFNLYATYALSSLFNKDEGPELHPFTLGIRILAI